MPDISFPFDGPLHFDGPDDAPATFAFAHGAGAPMDSDFMNAVASGLAAKGHRVARFEFPYMAERRASGKKRPPDRGAKLLDCWRSVALALNDRPLIVGGKSMGGRMASLIAEEIGAAGLICFGYPFHPPGKPEKLRTAHLESLKTPSLIIQGNRDPFGRREEVESYALSPAIELFWAEDGDHDLKPRKASGRSHAQNLEEAIGAADRFLQTLKP